jgi:hypothetical protein
MVSTSASASWRRSTKFLPPRYSMGHSRDTLRLKVRFKNIFLHILWHVLPRTGSCAQKKVSESDGPGYTIMPQYNAYIMPTVINRSIHDVNSSWQCHDSFACRTLQNHVQYSVTGNESESHWHGIRMKSRIARKAGNHLKLHLHVQRLFLSPWLWAKANIGSRKVSMLTWENHTASFLPLYCISKHVIQ